MNYLFDDNGATFNVKRTHRQKLWRIWDTSKPVLIMVGMNPSTADEVENDNTVTRVARRAVLLGYGGIVMLNVLDVIETDSRKLADLPAEDMCTSDNIMHLLEALDEAQKQNAEILCAWGTPGKRYGPVAWFCEQAHRRHVTLFCLKRNADGSPTHPLYLPYNQPFEWFGGRDRRFAAKPLTAS